MNRLESAAPLPAQRPMRRRSDFDLNAEDIEEAQGHLDVVLARLEPRIDRSERPVEHDQ
jgi:hypothetical protein